MLLPLSCTQKENEPHAPLPADILGMWMPTSEASVSGTDRYVEFADGQCYSYVSYDNHSVRNGYIVTTTSPFSLVNSRYCHLAANGNLIIGNKDMGKLTFINEFGGEQQKVMIIGSERYLPLKGFTSSDDARPRFSASISSFSAISTAASSRKRRSKRPTRRSSRTTPNGCMKTGGSPASTTRIS